MFILFISCDNTNKIVDPLPVENLAYQFSDYIHFDTTNAYLVGEAYSNFPNQNTEMYLYWEGVVGEQFIDVDSNGVYDRGIDLFIRDTTAENMDLNHDGIYNGPDQPWQYNVPFDDINGNGLYDGTLLNYPRPLYSVGKPFYDYNNNGKWDNNLPYKFHIYGCNSLTNDSSKNYSFVFVDSTFKYVSDSNLTYWLNSVNGFSYRSLKLSFEVLDNNHLTFKFPGSDYYEYLDYLVDSSVITTDTSEFFGSISYGPRFSITKETILGEELEYNSILYSDLLLIRLSYFSTVENRDLSLEFYFSKELGFIAFINDLGDSSYGKKSYYFIEKFPTIPYPLTK